MATAAVQASRDRLQGPSATFAVITNFDDQYEVGFLCAAVNQAYCERWGVRFLPCVLTQQEMECVCEGRHFAWAKLALFTWLFTPERTSQAAKRVFETWLSEESRAELLQAVDYIVWIDGDAMVLEHDLHLSHFVQGSSGHKDIVIAEDMSWADWVNTGVFFVRASSEWVQNLWYEAWAGASTRFHHAPFWDQSGLCQALTRRREFAPDVLGAHATGLQPSESPWYSWSGGRSRKDTPHMAVLSAATLQFANPLHAHFILHLCGYTDKLALCRATIRLGALRHAAAMRTEIKGLSGHRWEEAVHTVQEACRAAKPCPWGWCIGDAAETYQQRSPPCPVRKGVFSEAMQCWGKQGFEEEPVSMDVTTPPLWSLDDLRSRHGELHVAIYDCFPLRAADRPRSGFPHRTARVRLWHICDYVRGVPPPCHRVLGQLDSKRQWRVARWAPWEDLGCNGPEPPWESTPVDSAWTPLSTASHRLRVTANDALARLATVHVSPPGSRTRLHCPSSHTGSHFVVWQLEGDAKFALFPPSAAPSLRKKTDETPFFDDAQSALDPWACADRHALGNFFEVTLKAGQALLIPRHWWITSLSCSPSLAVWRPWMSEAGLEKYLTFHQAATDARHEFQYPAQAREFGSLINGLPHKASSPSWRKEILREGRGCLAPCSGAFHAVAHIDIFKSNGQGVRSSRLAPGGTPEVFLVAASCLPFGEVFEELLRSMRTGELARAVLLAVPSESESKDVRPSMTVLELELLAALKPEAQAEPQTSQRMSGGWCWFGDPDNWLGAPPGHEPVDQVEAARQREAASARQGAHRLTHPASIKALSRRSVQSKTVSFAASPVCSRRSWPRRKPRQLACRN